MPLLNDRKKAICTPILERLAAECNNPSEGVECLLLCITEQAAKAADSMDPELINDLLDRAFSDWMALLRRHAPPA